MPNFDKLENYAKQIYNINLSYADDGLVKSYSLQFFINKLTKNEIIYISKKDIVLGYIVINLYQDQKFVNLALIGVKKEKLGSNIALQLIKLLKKQYKKKIIILNVKPDNERAIVFYKKAGFKFADISSLKNPIMIYESI